jgi:hypothetical protein
VLFQDEHFPSEPCRPDTGGKAGKAATDYDKLIISHRLILPVWVKLQMVEIITVQNRVNKQRRNQTNYAIVYADQLSCNLGSR